MAFSGLSTNKAFTANLVGEDVSEIIRTLAPYEAPFLDWLGDPDGFAMSTKHEWIEDRMRPRTFINSSAINSATAATGIQVPGIGEALTVGTVLEITGIAPERMQVTSIVAGGNSILVSRNYDGAGIGSLAAGGTIVVRAPSAPEGDEHNGLHTARLGNRRANTVGYFKIEIATTGTQMGINQYGNDNYENARAKALRELPAILEAEVLTGVLNGTNSLGTSAATRTMLGLRGQLTAINSAVVDASFSANPHLYIGDLMQQAFNAGAATTETWGIIAGTQYFRDISNLNDTKVQDSNQSEMFKRVIRTYTGPFGQATVFLSRALATRELMVVPRERVRVLPLQSRNFVYKEMGLSGDNLKGMLVGDYVNETYSPEAMGRLRTSSPV
ncbi:MAG: DUF5309 family protein [Vicinamibacterales bacterium]